NPNRLPQPVDNIRVRNRFIPDLNEFYLSLNNKGLTIICWHLCSSCCLNCNDCHLYRLGGYS
ncbi:MAG: hypothetical protein ACKPFF_07695, partial [Planktothrix sp.]